MITFLKKTYSLFTKEEKRRVIWLTLAMTGVAVLEVMGIAFILPFMAVLANPHIINTSHILNSVYVSLGFTSPHQFLLSLGVFILALLIFGNSFSAITLWRMLKFSNLQESSLSTRLLSRYLNKPYTYFLDADANQLAKNILAEVTRIVDLILTPGIQLLAKIISVLFILTFLVIINPLLALIIFIALGGSYLLPYILLKKKMAHSGKENHESNAERFKTVNESFAAIKDIKFLHLEESVVANYKHSAYRHALAKAQGNTMAQIPRFFPETIAFGGILLYLLYMLSTGSNLSHLIPVLAAYVYAGMRLMPALQAIYNSSSLVRYGLHTLNELQPELAEKLGATQKKPTADQGNNTISLKEQISLKDLSYAYTNTKKNILNKLNLTIKAHSVIGLVGQTGAGKTTIIDLILGLLNANSGSISIDNTALDADNIHAWQNNIGYVPQHIYLTNDSILSNIAFGINTKEIDPELVQQVAKIAKIHDFIESDLTAGYMTDAGDRGIRLSGGQKQRLGIARALYRQPEILILDEATSALDSLTEKQVLENIISCEPKRTIIIITHRLSTLQICDDIFILEKDQGIIEHGDFKHLANNSATFKALLNSQANQESIA